METCTDVNEPGTRTPSSPSNYNAYYFKTGCGTDYHNKQVFQALFDHFARNIHASIKPKTVLDAGCAMGYLVVALRNAGIQAFGIDISDYAISQVPEAAKSYCRVGSILEPFDRKYDLITCIEVLEHLPGDEPRLAVANLCQHTDDILFSSSPHDYKEATHFNVHPPEFWVDLFAREGFYRDLDFDASFLTPWAIRFRRSTERPERIVATYERHFSRLVEENRQLREVTNEDRNKLGKQDSQLAELQKLAETAQAELSAARAAAIRLETELQSIKTVSAGFKAELDEAKQAFARIHGSRGWRWLNRYYRVRNGLASGARRISRAAGACGRLLKTVHGASNPSHCKQ